MFKLNSFEETLLKGWEDVYHKSQLTLWLLLALRDSDKHMAEIKSFIGQATNKLLTPDEKSIYRTLRRLTGAELISFSERPGKGGPDYKVFRLSQEGNKVLTTFLERNVIDIYYRPEIRTLIMRGNI